MFIHEHELYSYTIEQNYYVRNRAEWLILGPLKVTGYSSARSGITSGNCGFCARCLREYSYIIYMTAVFITDGKWKYEPTLFLAKNKNEDSDLSWTADLKINLDKL